MSGTNGSRSGTAHVPIIQWPYWDGVDVHQDPQETIRAITYRRAVKMRSAFQMLAFVVLPVALVAIFLPTAEWQDPQRASLALGVAFVISLLAYYVVNDPVRQLVRGIDEYPGIATRSFYEQTFAWRRQWQQVERATAGLRGVRFSADFIDRIPELPRCVWSFEDQQSAAIPRFELPRGRKPAPEDLSRSLQSALAYELLANGGPNTVVGTRELEGAPCVACVTMLADNVQVWTLVQVHVVGRSVGVNVNHGFQCWFHAGPQQDSHYWGDRTEYEKRWYTELFSTMWWTLILFPMLALFLVLELATFVVTSISRSLSDLSAKSAARAFLRTWSPVCGESADAAGLTSLRRPEHSHGVGTYMPVPLFSAQCGPPPTMVEHSQLLRQQALEAVQRTVQNYGR